MFKKYHIPYSSNVNQLKKNKKTITFTKTQIILNLKFWISNLIFRISNLDWVILASVLSLIITSYYMRKTSIVFESIQTKERQFRKLFFFLFLFQYLQIYFVNELSLTFLISIKRPVSYYLYLLYNIYIRHTLK